MTSNKFENLEDALKTLGKRANLSFSKKQSIRDRVFRSIGQVELADAIVEGQAKAGKLEVSLRHLKQALIPHRLSFSMPATIAVVVFVFFASIMTGALAQSSSPTSALFPVKKVLERIELAFITNPVSRAKATLNIADERLKQLEESLGEEKALNTVLKESQVALVSARNALAKVQSAPTTGEEIDKGIDDLLQRFSSLLSDQRIILEDIEKNSEDEELKNTVVAVREALEDKPDASKEADDTVVDTSTSTSNSTANSESSEDSTGADTKEEAELRLPDGYQTFVGRIGTAYGKPVIFVGSQYYEIKLSPIDLGIYVGQSGAVITGEIEGDQVKIYRIAIGNSAWGGRPGSNLN